LESDLGACRDWWKNEGMHLPSFGRNTDLQQKETLFKVVCGYKKQEAEGE